MSTDLLEIVQRLSTTDYANSLAYAKLIQYYQQTNQSPLSLTEIVNRLHNNEPLEYVIGLAEFNGAYFNVDQNCLIPRIETETMVSMAVDFISKQKAPYTVVDIGTGSGIIIISVAKQLKNRNSTIQYVGVDISTKALQVAKENASIHDVDVEFIHADATSNLPTLNQPPYIVLSNFPYIPTNEMPTLPSSVQKEPTIALDGGDYGVGLYQKLWKLVRDRYKPALEIYEIHSTTANKALQIYSQINPTRRAEIVTDVFEQPRFLVSYS